MRMIEGGLLIVIVLIATTCPEQALRAVVRPAAGGRPTRFRIGAGRLAETEEMFTIAPPVSCCCITAFAA